MKHPAPKASPEPGVLGSQGKAGQSPGSLLEFALQVGIHDLVHTALVRAEPEKNLRLVDPPSTHPTHWGSAGKFARFIPGQGLGRDPQK